MDVVLLNTNVVSFLLKGDSRAALYAPHLQGRRLAVSFMTVTELFQWAFVRGWAESRRHELEASLRMYLVFPFDVALCRYGARFAQDVKRKVALSHLRMPGSLLQRSGTRFPS